MVIIAVWGIEMHLASWPAQLKALIWRPFWTRLSATSRLSEVSKSQLLIPNRALLPITSAIRHFFPFKKPPRGPPRMIFTLFTFACNWRVCRGVISITPYAWRTLTMHLPPCSCGGGNLQYFTYKQFIASLNQIISWITRSWHIFKRRAPFAETPSPL